MLTNKKENEKENEKIVFYIGNFIIPDGNAAGKRVSGVGKIFQSLGYRVIYIGFNQKCSPIDQFSYRDVSEASVSCYSVPYPQNNLKWLSFHTILKHIVKILQMYKNNGADVSVVLYGSLRVSVLNGLIIKYCRRMDIRVVVDVVDWLTANTNSKVFNAVKNIDNYFQKAVINQMSDGVIAISSYLNSYYTNNNLLSITIPPVSAETEAPPRVKRKGPIRLLYAGLPFRKGTLILHPAQMKDRIDLTILALEKAKVLGACFVFDIYGFSKEEYLKSFPHHENVIISLNKSINFIGYVSNKRVSAEILNSDYTILIRDENRSTKAGFPTKVSESINLGTPVVTTRSSDIAKYLYSDETVIFLDNHVSPISLGEQMYDIISTGREMANRLSEYCYNSNAFHYSSYRKRLKYFIAELVSSKRFKDGSE
jgi:glycosyltransferase involved in cell wall biosynthesis